MATPGEPVPLPDAGVSSATRRFPFRFSGVSGLACRAFLVTPASAWATVSLHELEVRFGPWRVATPLDNVASAEESGPYRWPRVAGPARLSARDHGLTFATTAEAGVCLTFHEPIPAAQPVPRWTHPGLTVTVEDPSGFVALLRQRIGPDGP